MPNHKKVKTKKQQQRQAEIDKILSLLAGDEPFKWYATAITRKFKWPSTKANRRLATMEEAGLVRSKLVANDNGAKGAKTRRYRLMAKGKRAVEKLTAA